MKYKGRYLVVRCIFNAACAKSNTASYLVFNLSISVPPFEVIFTGYKRLFPINFPALGALSVQIFAENKLKLS